MIRTYTARLSLCLIGCALLTVYLIAGAIVAERASSDAKDAAICLQFVLGVIGLAGCFVFCAVGMSLEGRGHK